jgi:hypothetical protein
MAQKADGESKPNEAADPRGGDLPLEDPRWIPLIIEHKRLAERLTSSGLAAGDLTKAMADGVIRSMGRKAGGRELLSSKFWAKDYELYWSRIHGLELHPRRRGNVYVPVRGWVFFIWEPDRDKLWPPNPSPPAEPKVEQEAEDSPSKGIPGRRPTRDWPIVVAAEVVRLARAGALERPTSTAMIKHCEDKIKFSPKPEPMRLLLKRLWP